MRKKLENAKQEAKGYLFLSEDYLASAETLIRSEETGALMLKFGHPIDQIIGHAFELVLKSVHLHHFQDPERIPDFGHDINRLFSFLRDARSAKSTKELLMKAEQAVFEEWKEQLKTWRLAKKEASPNFFKTMEEREGVNFGPYVNEFKTALRKDVAWYSQRLVANGNEFRYYRTKHDSWPQARYFDHTLNRPRNSLIWGTRFLIKQQKSALL